MTTETVEKLEHMLLRRIFLIRDINNNRRTRCFRWMHGSRQDLLGWSILLAAIIGWALAVFQFYFRDLGPWEVFDADDNTYAALYQDLFLDGFRWSGWSMPPAPEYFPSMLAYFIVRALSPNVFVATFVFLVIKQIALMLAILALAYAVLRRIELSSIALAFVCSAALLLLVGKAPSGDASSIAFQQYMPLVTQPLAHSGTALCAILLLAMFFQWLLYSGRNALLALFVLTALAAGSDILIVPFFVGPTITLCALLYIAQPLERKRAATLITVLVAAALVGRLAGHAITPWDIVGGYLETSSAKSAKSLGIFIVDVIHYIQTGNFLFYLMTFCSLAGATWITIVSWRRGLSLISSSTANDPHQLITILVAFWLLATLLSVGAMLFFGLYLGPYMTRYILLPQVLCLYGCVILFTHLFRKRSKRLRLVSACCVAAVYAALVWTWQKTPLEQTILNYYPPELRCLEGLAAKHGLQYGLSGYWDAKKYTVLSRTNLRIYQLEPSGDILHLDNNIDWYAGLPESRYSDPHYTFLIQDPLEKVAELDAAFISEHYGPPATVEKCDNLNVWIYTGANQKSLQWLVEDRLAEIGHDDSPLNKPGGKIIIPASALRSQTGERDGTSRVAQPADASGALIFGPYYRLHSGRFLFELSYDLEANSQEPKSDWDVVIDESPLMNGTLEPDDHVVQATVDVPKAFDGKAAQFRVWYKGGGTLAVHQIAIERLQ